MIPVNRLKGFDPDKIFFISDTHFDHEKVIGFCKRPFKDREEMNTELVGRWNSKVPANATVFILGDFAFGEWGKYLPLLAGRKILVRGNHDRDPKALKKAIEACTLVSVHDILRITVNLRRESHVEKQDIVLCHYPFLSWEKQRHHVWHLHGHCHNQMSHTFDSDSTALRYDVGVDGNDFTPLSYWEIERIMLERECTR
jgi:calcineurin-like phosphoesterase family protein